MNNAQEIEILVEEIEEHLELMSTPMQLMKKVLKTKMAPEIKSKMVVADLLETVNDIHSDRMSIWKTLKEAREHIKYIYRLQSLHFEKRVKRHMEEAELALHPGG